MVAFLEEYHDIIANELYENPECKIHSFFFPRCCGSSTFLIKSANSANDIGYRTAIVLPRSFQKQEFRKPKIDPATHEMIVKLSDSVEIYTLKELRHSAPGTNFGLILCDNVFAGDPWTTSFIDDIYDFTKLLKPGGKIVNVQTCEVDF